MAVKIVGEGEPQLYSLTSPPAEPKPQPDSEMVWKKVSYPDRAIIVSVPFPDKVSLIAEIQNEHLWHPSSAASKEAQQGEMNSDLLEWLAVQKTETSEGVAPHITLGAKPSATFKIPIHGHGHASAHLTVSRYKYPAGAKRWFMRVEFNPARLGAAGVVQLTAQISQCLLPLIVFEKLLPALRVSRVDVAVDCIGAQVIDLIVNIEKPGKRMLYVGESGLPESVYFFGHKAPLSKPSTIPSKTTGPLRLLVYDKRAECIQHNLPAPYGNAPLTRVEAIRTWKQNRPLLSELGGIDNIFGTHRVAYAPQVGAYRRDWKAYCKSAAGVGVSGAVSHLRELTFRKWHLECSGDLVDAQCWPEWGRGLAMTGMDKLIELASK